MANAIVERLANKSGLTKKQAEEVYKNVFELVKESLIAGDDVRVHGFGMFRVKSRPEREGRNPSTGLPITIPASKTVALKVAESLKKSL